MFKFLFKKTKTPVSNEIKEVDAVQLWIVNWYSRYDEYSVSVKKEYEAFISEDEANKFADSLRKAYKLLRHTSGTQVTVEKN